MHAQVLGSAFYPIIDTDVCAARGLDALAVGRACLRGGARLLQVRQKTGSSAALLTLADELVGAGRSSAAIIIINDRPDIARMAGASGVHLGQEDLPVEAAMAIAGTGMLTGLSTHDRDQIDLALDGPASYVAVGPIFGTPTKATGYSARGLDLVRYASGRGKPIVAIGGITLERAPDVIAAGASAVAVIADVLTGGDAEARTRQFLMTLGG